MPLFNHLYKTNGETPQPYLRADIQELRQHPNRKRGSASRIFSDCIAACPLPGASVGFCRREFHRHEDQRQHDQHAADDQIRCDHLRHHLRVPPAAAGGTAAARRGWDRFAEHQLLADQYAKMIPSELKICEKLMRWVEVSSGPSRLE